MKLTLEQQLAHVIFGLRGGFSSVEWDLDPEECYLICKGWNNDKPRLNQVVRKAQKLIIANYPVALTSSNEFIRQFAELLIKDKKIDKDR